MIVLPMVSFSLSLWWCLCTYCLQSNATPASSFSRAQFCGLSCWLPSFSPSLSFLLLRVLHSPFLPFSAKSNLVLLLDIRLAAALAVVGRGRGRELGSVQVGVDGGLVFLEEALEKVVVDKRGAIPARVAQVHEEGQLERVIEGDPGQGGEGGKSGE